MHPLTTYLVEGSFLGISVTSWLERDDASGEKENLNPCGRNRHHRSASAVDLMIAATAAHHGLTVLHDDADYRTAVARHAPDMAEHNIHDTV
jgi:hypothetical protein